MAHDHHHGSHHHEALTPPPGRTRALAWSLGANGAFLVVELVGGIAFASLALLADAAHMATDVAGLAVALVAVHLAQRPPTARNTYGWQRAEVFGAILNGVALLAASGWIAFEAIRRIDAPADVNGAGLLLVATAGLVVNVASAVMLRRQQGRSLNMRGAVLHMAVDAAASVGAMVAGVAVLVADATWVDPAVSLLIVVAVLWSTYGLLRDALGVVFESAPANVDVVAVERVLEAAPGVRSVHHLHVWSIASDVPALSAHVVLEDASDLHDAQRRGDRLKELLANRFGIEHATLELECHECAPQRT